MAKSYSRKDECGNIFWYKEGTGIAHREDGPAIEWNDGGKEWQQDGKLHRINGPAISFVGMKVWYINGKRHRLDGPAVEVITGERYWWHQGKYIPVRSQENYERYLKLIGFE